MSAWDDGMNMADQLRESVYEIRALKARIAELEAELAVMAERTTGWNLMAGRADKAESEVDRLRGDLEEAWRAGLIAVKERDDLDERVAELEAALAGQRACLVEHGQRLAAVIALCDEHDRGLYLDGNSVRAAATGDQT